MMVLISFQRDCFNFIDIARNVSEPTNFVFIELPSAFYISAEEAQTFLNMNPLTTAIFLL